MLCLCLSRCLFRWSPSRKRNIISHDYVVVVVVCRSVLLIGGCRHSQFYRFPAAEAGFALAAGISNVAGNSCMTAVIILTVVDRVYGCLVADYCKGRLVHYGLSSWLCKPLTWSWAISTVVEYLRKQTAEIKFNFLYRYGDCKNIGSQVSTSGMQNVCGFWFKSSSLLNLSISCWYTAEIGGLWRACLRINLSRIFVT